MFFVFLLCRITIWQPTAHADQEAPENQRFVVPPNQEQGLESSFKSFSREGVCTYKSGALKFNIAQMTFVDPNGAVALDLRLHHPKQAPTESVVISTLAVEVKQGAGTPCAHTVLAEIRKAVNNGDVLLQWRDQWGAKNKVEKKAPSAVDKTTHAPLPGAAQNGANRTLLPRGFATLLAKGENDAPEVEGRYSLEAISVEPGQARIRYTIHKSTRLDVVLVNADSETRAFAQTPSFKIFYAQPQNMDVATRASFMEALNAVIARIRDNDDGNWKIDNEKRDVRTAPAPAPSPGWGTAPPPILGAHHEPTSTGHSASPDQTLRDPLGGKDAGPGPPPVLDLPRGAHMAFGFGLLLLALLWIPLLCVHLSRRFSTLTTKARRALVAAIAVGGILRIWLAPFLVVTMYMGFKLADRAWMLNEYFRYGVGAQALWHSLFRVTGPDHAHMVALNACLGTISLGLLAAVVRRVGVRPMGVAIVVGLVAITPMLIWSDASDSLSVPVIFWTLGATVFAQEAFDKGRLWDTLGAVLWLAMAAHTRPEHVFFGPALVLTIIAIQHGEPSLRDRLRATRRVWLVGVVGYAVLALPQFLYALKMRQWMMAHESWPHTWQEVLVALPELILKQNAMLDPAFVAPALVPLALLGIYYAKRPSARRFRLGLLTFGFAWMLFYYIDLSTASLPRLHVVMLLPMVIVVGDLLSDLTDPKVFNGYARRWVPPTMAVLAVVALASGLPRNVDWLWQDTNEREEERFFREAIAHLPEEAHILVHSADQDNEPGRRGDAVHQHYPDYLVRPPAGNGEVLSIAQQFHRPLSATKPTFFYLGMRCYSDSRIPSAEKPKQYFLPACREMQTTFKLEPVLERKVVNHGDLALHYYSEEPTYLLGLYRVTAGE